MSVCAVITLCSLPPDRSDPAGHATPRVLPLSFTILWLPHPFLPLPPQPSSSHPGCPPCDGNYNSVDTLAAQGPRLFFSFCPAASVSLSVSFFCLPVSACFCLAEFLSTPHPSLSVFLTQYFSTHGCFFRLLSHHQVSLWLFLHFLCSFTFFNFVVLLFSCFFPQLLQNVFIVHWTFVSLPIIQ